ncbi:hypothetical protein OHA70_09845 [Kribbella sp. NBC_00382]|uniref:hypothetical protein n=1 Tax=Kribbella sp. NBC_00382 TaxID=2975967 RepID=UPI002E1F48A4
MRYLAKQLAIGALRRGQPIQQFLGPATGFELAGIRYLEIRPAARYELYLYFAEDIGTDQFFDVGEFPSLEVRDEEDGFGRLIARADEPELALETARRLAGAAMDRWVNAGLVEAEYVDYLVAGRPADAALDGYRWPVQADPPSLVSDGMWR